MSGNDRIASSISAAADSELNRDAAADPALSDAATDDLNVAATTDDRASFSAQWPRIYPLIPVMLALVSSFNTLSNRWAYDGSQQILKNELIRGLRNAPRLFTSTLRMPSADDIQDAEPYFRPIVGVFRALIYSVAGYTPWVWHLASDLVHAAAALLVFYVCAEITGRRRLALIAASLFAVSPAHSEAIAWLSAVCDPLMAVFALAAFYLYLRRREDGPKYFLIGSLFLFLIALLCKETAVVLPIVILCWEALDGENTGSLVKRLLNAARSAALFVIPLAIYLLMRVIALGGLTGSLDPGRTGFRLLTVPLVLAKYILLMAWPVNYSVHQYIDPVASILTVRFIVPVLFIIALIWGIARVRSRVALFSGLWFVVWLLPPLASVGVLNPLLLVQERYLYLPSFGFCFALAAGVEWLAARKPFNIATGTALAAASIPLIVISSFLLISQNTLWRDTRTLFRNSVEQFPTSGYAHSILSTAYFEAGELKAAEEEAKTGFEVEPLCFDAYINAALYAQAGGDAKRALRFMERAESAARGQPLTTLHRIYRTLGQLYQSNNDNVRAEEYLRRAVDAVPGPYPTNWYALGDFYLSQARYEEAREMFEAILGKVPKSFAPIHYRLGRVYDRLGDMDRARIEYEQYIKLAPSSRESLEVRRRLAQVSGAPTK